MAGYGVKPNFKNSKFRIQNLVIFYTILYFLKGLNIGMTNISSNYYKLPKI